MPHRIALIVGIKDYTQAGLGNLNAPVNDANAMLDVLKQYSDFHLIGLPREVDTSGEKNRYQVAERGYLTAQDLQKELRAVFTTNKNTAPADALFYFSGHGARETGMRKSRSYLACSDTTHGLDLEDLAALIADSAVRNVVMILDCCHVAEVSDFFTGLRGKNLCLIAASTPLTEALAVAKRSLLTDIVLQGLHPANGVVRTDTLARFIQDYPNKPPQILPPSFLSNEFIELTRGPKNPTSFENRSGLNASTPETIPNYDIHLPHTANPELIGRGKELKLLTNAWKNQKTHIVVLVAMGGTGKTALLKHWLDKLLSSDKAEKPRSAFAYSFYSQGAAEDKQTDAEDFFRQAFAHFAYDGEMPTNQYDKGRLLAQWVSQEKALLVLDGLEPLQHPQGVMRGELKDKGLLALVRQLALHNPGLCLISSRQAVTELAGKEAVLSHDLSQLDTADGVTLLQKILGATNEVCQHSKQDFENAVTELGGHALALNLLGQYLLDVCDGDIRRRDTISALNEVAETGEHAQKVMRAYEQHLHGTADLALLYLLGLFDRPVSQAALDVLAAPALNPPDAEYKDEERLQLTQALRDLSPPAYGAMLRRLRQQGLLNQPVRSEDFSPHKVRTEVLTTNTLDCHPLLREYFAQRLQTRQPQAWQQAHRQLYEYYKSVPDKEQPDTLEEMQPLFAAVAHGCAAGLHQQALDEVYYPRIQRDGNENYLCNKLGGFASDLAVVAHFFSRPWDIPTADLSDAAKAAVLSWSAFRLYSLGRLAEAGAPMQAGMNFYIAQKGWQNAAQAARNVSELHITLGDLPAALSAVQQGVSFADDSGNEFFRMGFRTSLADVQHHSGAWAAAAKGFAEAEAIQKQRQPELPLLYSLWGFHYSNYLLSLGDWQQAQMRTQITLEWGKNRWETSLLDIALNQLTLGSANLQQAVLPTVNWQAPDSDAPHTPRCPAPDLMLPTNRSGGATNAVFSTARDWLDQAVAGLYKAGQENYLPRALLTRAAHARFAQDWDSARRDLQTVFDTATRGGMLLFLCDAHLEAARLALLNLPDAVFDDQPASAHLDQAAALIAQTGYERRRVDLDYLRGLAPFP